MSASHETIALGGRHFMLRPLKLGQLRRLLDALAAMEGRSGGALIEAAAEVVAAGLAPAHPGLTGEALLDVEATVAELNAAVATVLRVAGLRASGEAAPVASPASSSALSTAPSPPAAAIPIATSTG